MAVRQTTVAGRHVAREQDLETREDIFTKRVREQAVEDAEVIKRQQKLDAAIDSGEIETSVTLLNSTGEALQNVLDELIRVLPPRSQGKKRVGGPARKISKKERNEIEQNFGRLFDFLVKNDLEAEDIAQEMNGKLHGTQYEEDVREIITALSEFDFSTALEKSSALRKKILEDG